MESPAPSASRRPPPPKRVAIIGFAGGHVPLEMHSSLTTALYEKMVATAESIITKQFGLEWSDVALVSGGAPWGDHVAVSLFIQNDAAGLTIYAPCRWKESTGRFVENDPGKVWCNRSGLYENRLNTEFAAQTQVQSFDDLRAAVAIGAVMDSSYAGFHARNRAIARSCDYMIAFSWSDASEPSEGGTSQTWHHTSFTVTKVHVPMKPLAAQLRPRKRRVIEAD